MEYVINTRLLGNPMNWFSIAAMLLLVFAIFLAVRSHWKASGNVAVENPDNPATAFAQEK
jgi:hypothetical protein